MSSSHSLYVIDSDQATELARLIEQSKLFTRAMGGLFPEELDLSHVERVLDLACGPGDWVLDVAFDLPEAEVAGVDINRSMIDYAHARARSQGRRNATFGVMDITRTLDFSDGTFDLVNARFIVGFQDISSWPALLRECHRILCPGGVLLLSEAERSISTSPSLQRLEGWLTRALFEQGRTFSTDGQTIGIVHLLGKLLEQAGFADIGQRAFVLDASNGSLLYAASLVEFDVTYRLLRPYLLDSHVVDATTFDHEYSQMLIETRLDDFRCLGFGLSTWGYKRGM